MANEYSISLKALDEASATIKRIKDSLTEVRKAEEESNQASQNNARREKGRFAGLLDGIKILGKNAASELDKITKQFEKLGGGIGEVVGALETAWKLGGIAAGIYGAIKLGEAFKQAADRSRELQIQTEKLKTSSQDLQKLQFTFKHFGVTPDQTFSALEHVGVTLREARAGRDKEAAQLFDKVPELRGWRDIKMTEAEFLEKYRRSEKNRQNFVPGGPYEDTPQALRERELKVVGSEDLLPVLKASNEEYQKSVEAAKGLTTELDKTTSEFTRLSKTINDFGNQLTSLTNDLKNSFTPLVKIFNDFAEKNPALAMAGVGAAGAAGAAGITFLGLKVVKAIFSYLLPKSAPELEKAIETELTERAATLGLGSIIGKALGFVLGSLLFNAVFAYFTNISSANKGEPSNFKGQPLDVMKLTPEQAQQVLDTQHGLSDSQKEDLRVRSKGGAVAPLSGKEVGGPGHAGGYSLGQMKTLAMEAGFEGEDADRMAAVAMVESSGNPNARGSAGEYGLTQINPKAWGEELAKQALNPKRAFEIAHDVFLKQGWIAWKNSLVQAKHQYLDKPIQAEPVSGNAEPLPGGAANNDFVTGRHQLLIHHTGGRGTAQDVINTLNQRGLGVQFIMDRQGKMTATGMKSAHTMSKRGFSNDTSVGVEVIANDDADVLPIQRKAMKDWYKLHPEFTDIRGHGEVDPERKQETEGKTIANELREMQRSRQKEPLPLPQNKEKDVGPQSETEKTQHNVDVSFNNAPQGMRVAFGGKGPATLRLRTNYAMSLPIG